MPSHEQKLDKRRARARLLAHLRKGGHIAIEDVGGSVGERWYSPARSGQAFSKDHVDRLIAKGCIMAGVAMVLRRGGGDLVSRPAR